MKVSIIVPIYKADKYLEQCIQSLIAQDYADYEVILIDDGSPDYCGEICERYSAMYKQIQVIHQENAGVSAARNAGLHIAQGDYVTFVDADDWVESCFITRLVENMQDGGMSVCGFCREKDINADKFRQKNESEEVYEKPIAMSKEAAQKSVLCVNGMGGYICGKLYDMQIIRKYGLCFQEEIYIMEDHLFAMEYLKNIHSSVIWLKKPLYHYRDNPNSAVNAIELRNREIKTEKILSGCKAIQLEHQYIHPTPDLIKCLNAVEIFHKKYALIRLTIHGRQTCAEYKSFLHDIRSGFFNYWNYNIGESMKGRLLTLICCLSPNLCCFIWGVAKKIRHLHLRNFNKNK